MKKLTILLLIFFVPHFHFSQDNKTNLKMPILIDMGITGYGANIAFAGFDVDFSIGFFQKNNHTLFFKTSLPVFIPSSVFQAQAPYILFGVIWELQYSLSLKNGFLFALETGLGTAGEFFQVPIFTLEKGFQKNFVSSPFGLFSLGIRMGYDFAAKYRVPIKFGTFIGYRMQFPFNFTVKHFIMYGLNLSYTFSIGGSK